MVFRSMQHGSEFDFKLFEKLAQKQPNRHQIFPPIIRNKVTSFVHKLSEVIADCFAILESKEVDSGSLDAHQFLHMCDKVLPNDIGKLQRITL